MAGTLSAFFASTAFETAAASTVASTAVGLGINALEGKPKISIPPPPGAAMIDPAGATAAAQTRRQQAAAGGLASTVTGAGTTGGGPTSGAKQLLGS